jgi:hypothetical protein
MHHAVKATMQAEAIAIEAANRKKLECNRRLTSNTKTP